MVSSNHQIMGMRIWTATIYSTFIYQPLIIQKSRLTRRGPDKSRQEMFTCGDIYCVMCGFVLHLRGLNLTSQPFSDQDGNLLMWNGDIFGGIYVRWFGFLVIDQINF